MKRSNLLVLGVMVMAMAMYGRLASAEDAASPKTISGKSACATCSGVTSAGHAIMIVADDGTRWVLVGDSASYKAAHDVRKQGKTMTATLAGEPVERKDEDGKAYKEVKVSDVKVNA